MARGFGATLGVSTSDLIRGASFATPTSGSFSAWYNRNGAGGLGNARIFDKEGSTPGEMILRNNNASGTITMSRGFTTTSGQWETSDAEAIATGKWVHIVATWDGVAGNVPIFYINGRLATMTTTTASAGTAKNVSGVLSIGNRTTSGVCWDGLIGNCGFWSNYILTAAEARALYQGADPRAIRPQYLSEYLILSEARPYSAVKSTQPTVTGTKPRADRLVVAQGLRFPFCAVTSGTTYNDTLTSSATATDGVTVTATFATTLTETATATDTVTALATFNATLSQGVTATDSSIGGSIFNDTLTQSATATDAYAQSVVFGPTLTETATGGDSYTVTATFAAALGETATAGFSLSDGSAASIWTTIPATSGTWGTQGASTGVWTTIPPSTGTWT